MSNFVAWYFEILRHNFHVRLVIIYTKIRTFMRKLLLTLFVILSTTAMAWAQSSLIVTFADGTRQAFLLSTLPDIKMADDKMTIKTSATTAEYDLYTVKMFTFGDATGISSLNTGRLSLNGDALVAPHANASVKAFALDGTEVRVGVSNTDSGSTVIDLSTLPAGKVYIIRVDGKAVKIIR